MWHGGACPWGSLLFYYDCSHIKWLNVSDVSSKAPGWVVEELQLVTIPTAINKAVQGWDLGFGVWALEFWISFLLFREILFLMIFAAAESLHRPKFKTKLIVHLKNLKGWGKLVTSQAVLKSARLGVDESDAHDSNGYIMLTRIYSVPYPTSNNM